MATRPFDRMILLVLDSVGIGALPDAAEFGESDPESDTLGHIREAVGLHLPHLCDLGLSRIRADFPEKKPTGAYGRMAERSKGKDTLTGHWEMTGLISDRGFPVYPDGFPDEVIEPFEKLAGAPVLGNKTASGTVIIEELGEEHLRTGGPIIYTSADSVFQVAAHEEIIPVERLYQLCRTARNEILVGKHRVGRVIARPFIGKPGAFTRTSRRKDFAVEPPGGLLLERLSDAGHTVISVGKIEDIFSRKGITRGTKTKDNRAGIDQTLAEIESGEGDLIFTNLVDFDSKYGHRNDPEGYRDALQEFDAAVPDLLNALNERDCLIITADHGNDPTTPSTDHSREYVPLLCYHPRIQPADLGTRSSFADLGATVAENFDIDIPAGQSFLNDLQ